MFHQSIIQGDAPAGGSGRGDAECPVGSYIKSTRSVKQPLLAPEEYARTFSAAKNTKRHSSNAKAARRDLKAALSDLCLYEALPREVYETAFDIIMSVPASDWKFARGGDDVPVAATDGQVVRHAFLWVLLWAAGQRAGTPAPPAVPAHPRTLHLRRLSNASTHSKGSTNAGVLPPRAPGGRPSPFPLTRALLDKLVREAGNTSKPVAFVAHALRVAGWAVRSLEHGSPRVDWADSAKREHQAVAEAIIKAADAAEGRKPRGKILTRAHFVKANQPGAVTPEAAGPLMAATLRSIRVADNLAMAFHVRESALAAVWSLHPACATEGLALAALMAVAEAAPLRLGPRQKVSAALHKLVVDTLEGVELSGRLAESPGGKVTRREGYPKPTDVSVIHLAAGSDARCYAAAMCGAMLTSREVDRHAKAAFRRMLLLLAADPRMEVAVHAALALCGEFPVAQSSPTLAGQPGMDGKVARMQAEAWAALTEALRGETPVHILIQSRLGTVLVPDLVRAANQPLPRGYGRPPETTAVDFTGVLSAHVQLWLTSTNPALVLSGLCVVRAMCRARTLHAALSASSQDAEAPVTPLSADASRTADPFLAALLRSAAQAAHPTRMSHLSAPSSASTLSLTAQSLVWACGTDPADLSLEHLPGLAHLGGEGGVDREHRALPDPWEGGARPGAAGPASAALVRPSQVAQALADALEHVTRALAAGSGAAHVPGDAPLPLLMLCRGVGEALASRAGIDPEFAAVAVDLALVLARGCPAGAAQVVGAVWTAVWGGRGRLAGRVWALLAALRVAESPMAVHPCTFEMPASSLSAAAQEAAGLTWLRPLSLTDPPAPPGAALAQLALQGAGGVGSGLDRTGSAGGLNPANVMGGAAAAAAAGGAGAGGGLLGQSVDGSRLSLAMTAARAGSGTAEQAWREVAGWGVESLMMAGAEWAAGRLPELAWMVLQESQAEEDESGSRAAQGDGAEASQGLEAVFAHRRSHRDAAAAADLRLQGTAVLRHCADRLAHLAWAGPERVRVACGGGLAAAGTYADEQTQVLCFESLSASLGRPLRRTTQPFPPLHPGHQGCLAPALAPAAHTLAAVVEARRAFASALAARGRSVGMWTEAGLGSLFDRSAQLKAQVTTHLRQPSSVAHPSSAAGQGGFFPLGPQSRPLLDAWRVARGGAGSGASSIGDAKGAGGTGRSGKSSGTGPRDLWQELEALEADADSYLDQSSQSIGSKGADLAGAGGAGHALNSEGSVERDPSSPGAQLQRYAKDRLRSSEVALGVNDGADNEDVLWGARESDESGLGMVVGRGSIDDERGPKAWAAGRWEGERGASGARVAAGEAAAGAGLRGAAGVGRGGPGTPVEARVAGAGPGTPGSTRYVGTSAGDTGDLSGSAAAPMDVSRSPGDAPYGGDANASEAWDVSGVGGGDGEVDDPFAESGDEAGGGTFEVAVDDLPDLYNTDPSTHGHSPATSPAARTGTPPSLAAVPLASVSAGTTSGARVEGGTGGEQASESYTFNVPVEGAGGGGEGALSDASVGLGGWGGEVGGSGRRSGGEAVSVSDTRGSEDGVMMATFRGSGWLGSASEAGAEVGEPGAVPGGAGQGAQLVPSLKVPAAATAEQRAGAAAYSRQGSSQTQASEADAGRRVLGQSVSDRSDRLPGGADGDGTESHGRSGASLSPRPSPRGWPRRGQHGRATSAGEHSTTGSVIIHADVDDHTLRTKLGLGMGLSDDEAPAAVRMRPESAAGAPAPSSWAGAGLGGTHAATHDPAPASELFAGAPVGGGDGARSAAREPIYRLTEVATGPFDGEYGGEDGGGGDGVGSGEFDVELVMEDGEEVWIGGDVGRGEEEVADEGRMGGGEGGREGGTGHEMTAARADSLAVWAEEDIRSAAQRTASQGSGAFHAAEGPGAAGAGKGSGAGSEASRGGGVGGVARAGSQPLEDGDGSSGANRSAPSRLRRQASEPPSVPMKRTASQGLEGLLPSTGSVEEAEGDDRADADYGETSVDLAPESGVATGLGAGRRSRGRGVSTRCGLCDAGYSPGCLPRVLPCGHVACEWCVERALKGREGNGSGTCPVPDCGMVIGIARKSVLFTVESMPIHEATVDAVRAERGWDNGQRGAGKGRGVVEGPELDEVMEGLSEMMSAFPEVHAPPAEVGTKAARTAPTICGSAVRDLACDLCEAR